TAEGHVRLPEATARRTRRQDRGRRLRGPLPRIPADAAEPARRPAGGAAPTARRARNIERDDEPRDARARPRGVAAGNLTPGTVRGVASAAAPWRATTT